MKIVFLSFYSGVVYRGVETYVHELADRLHSMGHDITVYQNGPNVYNGKYKTISIGVKYKVFKSGKLAILLNRFTGFNANRKFTKKVLSQLDKDTDFIIATNNKIQALLAKIWCLGKKTKLVISGQSGPGIDERFALYCFPDVFIPLSEYQKKWAKRINPFIHVSDVIYNGVSLEKFSKSVEKEKFNLKGKIILCAAAFWPETKRQDLLIRAASKLNNVSLILAGDGEGKEYLENLGRKILGDRFLINGFPYGSMPKVYAGADLFTFPTVPWESFGIVMAEAMASGLPVVATDDPIRREIVGDAGLFIDPTDTGAYAKALEKALEIDWGNKPRCQAEKFSWDKIAKEYEELFKKLL